MNSAFIFMDWFTKKMRAYWLSFRNILCQKDKDGEANMAYKRQIAYFDYIEDGQKNGNASFQ